MATHDFQAPTGTRDFYPVEMLRRRFIEKAWRDASVRHGFEEIDGPTFEHTTLYTVKSGEGILSELFSFTREGGEKAYALRPEFTPTLARMYAARAGQLSKPTRWFWQQSCFRAERPQKGRLREFLQWNCDLIGGDGSAEQAAAADAEIIATCVGLLASLGLTPADVQVRYNHRASLGGIVSACGIAEKDMEAALVLLDRREKLDNAELEAKAFEFGLGRGDLPGFYEFLTRARKRATLAEELGGLAAGVTLNAEQRAAIVRPLELLEAELERAGVREWCVFDLNVARGLAYYTGMVFEVHEVSGGQRAVAGGGRYDKLIELFGGPSTPAVGFGMGDVVLSLVLEDRKKFPEGRALLEELSKAGASLRPDAFVLSNGSAEADVVVKPLVAKLRAAGLHARVSGKATKNIGKLLQEASGCFSRFAVIVESASEATVKNLDTQEQARVGVGEVLGRVGG